MTTRILRDGILTSQRVNLLSEGAEVFYRRLMSVADDHGRFHAMPMLLRAACYPLKLDTMPDERILAYLAECETAELLQTYEAKGLPYLQLLDFNQRVQSKSKFPNPEVTEPLLRDSTVTHRGPTVENRLDEDVVVVGDVYEGASVGEGIAVLPDWLPASAWADFKAHRKSLKKPMSAPAEARMLKNLVKLRGQGVDVLEAMDAAIRSGWLDVYAPRESKGGPNREPAPLPRLRT